MALIGSVGCAGDLEKPERFDFLKTPAADGGSADGGGSNVPEPPACVTAAFKTSCSGAICHSANAALLDLNSPGVAGRLVNIKASGSVTVCSGKTYVTTDGSPSLLLEKFQDTPPCGSKMPLSGTLSDSDKKCITDWVTAVSSGTSSGEDGGT